MNYAHAHEMDGYTIQELLGSGGFASVYKAIKNDTNDSVALKVSVDRDRQYVDMLQRETELMSELRDTPHVVKLLKYFVAEDAERYVHVAVMPVLDMSLDALISSDDVASKDEIKRLARHVSSGLTHCNDLYIAHSDLKPDNILVKIDEEGNNTYLLSDFGSAFRIGEGEVSTYGHCGLYACPEILLEDFDLVENSCVCDSWSLGCLLYEFATKKLLFDFCDDSDEDDNPDEEYYEDDDEDYDDESGSASEHSAADESYIEEEGSSESSSLLDPLASDKRIGSPSEDDYIPGSDEHFDSNTVQICEIVRIIGPFERWMCRRHRDIFKRDGTILTHVKEECWISGEETSLRAEIEAYREDLGEDFHQFLYWIFRPLSPYHRPSPADILSHDWLK